MKDTEAETHSITPEELRTVISAIQSVNFGTVTISIQNGKMMQIDKTEKIRLR